MVQNRLELFAVEVEEEKGQLVTLFLLAAAVTIFGLMVLLMVTLAIVVLFWDNGRLYAVGGLALIYAIAGAWSWCSLRSRIRNHRAFAETIGELQKDRACLQGKP